MCPMCGLGMYLVLSLEQQMVQCAKRLIHAPLQEPVFHRNHHTHFQYVREILVGEYRDETFCEQYIAMFITQTYV